MKKNRQILSGVLATSIAFSTFIGISPTALAIEGNGAEYGISLANGESVENSSYWKVESEPILLPSAEDGKFNSYSVKDLSVVFYDGNYHMFYTASGNNLGKQEYTTGYAKAPTLEDFKTAEQVEVTNLKPETGTYYCAPQVFFNEYDGLWYLIYQVRASVGTYSAVYSTNEDISNVDGWTAPQDLLPRSIDPENKSKWIDFWVIEDETQMYLFYASGGEMAFRTTEKESFPNGLGEEQRFSVPGGYEASHIYKDVSDGQYYMVFEAGSGSTTRSFVLATTDKLDSKDWTVVNSRWAAGENMTETDWTEMPSHGEFIRLGYDTKMEISDIDHIEFIIQGVNTGEDGYNQSYPLIPWSLGVMRNYTNSLSISDTSLTLKTGETETITVTSFTSNNELDNAEIEWSSSDDSIVSVDQSGNLATLSGGVATITAKRLDNNETISCKVTVTQGDRFKVESSEFSQNSETVSASSMVNNLGTIPLNVKSLIVKYNSDGTVNDYSEVVSEVSGNLEVSNQMDINPDGSEYVFRHFLWNADTNEPLSDAKEITIPGTSSSSVILNETFEGETSLANWTIHDNVYSYVDGALLGSAGSGVKASKIEYNNITASDFIYSADVTISKFTGSNNSGLLFRTNGMGAGVDNLDGYSLSISDGSNKIELGRYPQDASKAFTELKSVPVDIVTGETYNLKVEAEGYIIKGYLNDDLMIEYDASNDEIKFDSGSFGLNVHRSDATFDNVKVTSTKALPNLTKGSDYGVSGESYELTNINAIKEDSGIKVSAEKSPSDASQVSLVFMGKDDEVIFANQFNATNSIDTLVNLSNADEVYKVLIGGQNSDLQTVTLKEEIPEPEEKIHSELYVEAKAEVEGSADSKFKLSLANTSNVYNISVTFETDGTDILVSAVDGYTVLNDNKGAVVDGMYEEEFTFLSEDAGSLINLLEKIKVANVNVTGEYATLKIKSVVVSGTEYGTFEIKRSEATYGNEHDVNNDGVVDGLDIAIIQQHYQASNIDTNWNEISHLDMNEDGKVDMSDIFEVYINRG